MPPATRLGGQQVMSGTGSSPNVTAMESLFPTQNTALSLRSLSASPCGRSSQLEGALSQTSGGSGPASDHQEARLAPQDLSKNQQQLQPASERVVTGL